MGMRCASTFEKGKTNKDRGNRVAVCNDDSNESEAQQPVNVTHTLKSGEALNFFLREDMLSDSKPFVMDPHGILSECEVLYTRGFVLAQLASANKEQALKGSLLKIKCLQTIEDAQTKIPAYMHKLPASSQAFHKIQDDMKESFAVAKQSFKDTMSMYSTMVDGGAYAVLDEASNVFHICNFDTENTLEIPAEVIKRAFGSTDSTRLVRILNIAIASLAVSAVVKSQVENNVVLNTDVMSSGYQAVFVHLDVNALLNLQEIDDSLTSWPASTDKSHLSLRTFDDGTLVWTNPKSRSWTARMKFNIVYAMNPSKKTLPAEKAGTTSRKALRTAVRVPSTNSTSISSLRPSTWMTSTRSRQWRRSSRCRSARRTAWPVRRWESASGRRCVRGRWRPILFIICS